MALQLALGHPVPGVERADGQRAGHLWVVLGGSRGGRGEVRGATLWGGASTSELADRQWASVPTPSETQPLVGPSPDPQQAPAPAPTPPHPLALDKVVGQPGHPDEVTFVVGTRDLLLTVHGGAQAAAAAARHNRLPTGLTRRRVTTATGPDFRRGLRGCRAPLSPWQRGRLFPPPGAWVGPGAAIGAWTIL